MGTNASLAGDPFEALGNSQRRAIVQLLSVRPHSVGELAEQLPISRPAVSRHLRQLSHAGLVSEETQGTRHLYRLHEEGLTAVRAYLEGVWGTAATRFQLFAENTGAPGTDPG